MIKKIAIIISLALAAQCAGRPQWAAPTRLAFADSYTQDGKPCPPECVSDSMEIVTWYPSPYNEYEELRLYPKRSAEESQCNSFDQLGLMYYNQDEQALKVCRFDSVAGYRWELVSYWKLDDSGNISNANSSGKVKIADGTQGDGKVLTSNSDGVASWKDSSAQGVQAANYSARPSCTSSNWGTIIYDTTENTPFICTQSDWVSMDTNLAARDLTYSGSTHARYDCMEAGGSVYETGSGSICKFSGTNVSCPSGWSQADSWQKYSASTFGGDGCGGWKSTAPVVFSNNANKNWQAGDSYGRGPGGSQCGFNNSLWQSPGSDNDWANPQPCIYVNAVVAASNNIATNRVEIGCK